MIGGGHFHVAEFFGCTGNPIIVGGYDDIRERRSLLALLNDALDEGFACDQYERLAGKPCRGVSGGDDGDDVERESGIDLEPSRCRAHDE